MSEQVIPAVGEYGDFNGHDGILLATGDDYFTEFVPWLEDIVREASLLGLEQASTDVECFLENDLELDCDSYDFDSDWPGTSAVYQLAWGDENSQSIVTKKALEAFAQWAENLKPGTKNAYEDNELFYIQTPSGKEKWSDLVKDESEDVLDEIYEDLPLEEVLTANGPCTVAWLEASDIREIQYKYLGVERPAPTPINRPDTDDDDWWF